MAPPVIHSPPRGFKKVESHLWLIEMHNKMSGRIASKPFMLDVPGEGSKRDSNVFTMWLEFYTMSWISFIILKGSQTFNLVLHCRSTEPCIRFPDIENSRYYACSLWPRGLKQPWSGSDQGNEHKREHAHVRSGPMINWPAGDGRRWSVGMFGLRLGALCWKWRQGLTCHPTSGSLQFCDSMWYPRNHNFF